jgi:hypothetical protein
MIALIPRPKSQASTVKIGLITLVVNLLGGIATIFDQHSLAQVFAAAAMAHIIFRTKG